jgi:maltose alpha-D-glucosyltransferase/alpha-amylase
VAGYLEVEGAARLLPESVAERDALLNAHLLDKALYELGYELDNRPSWVAIPVRAILELVLSRPAVAR